MKSITGSLSYHKLTRYGSRFLAAIALIYAFLAGLHTLEDFDLGWQLATGRWVVQHHQVFSTDVFSYTAFGAPWIYPVFSGVVFYLAYLAGGYALLSWLGAGVCVSTVVLLLRRNGAVAPALAVVAVPIIANRTQPRAEMFTTLLFATFLSLLWQHYVNGCMRGRSSLWLLPVLMVAWVNLHLGFVAGVGLCGAYLLLEVLDWLFPENRAAVRSRLRSAWLWLALTVVATVANPWGINIYRTLARQQQAQALHTEWIVEWEAVHLSWESLQEASDIRSPQSAFWWLLAIALLCVAIALWRKRLGAAVLLSTSLCFAMEHLRLQVLFACVTVIVGGWLLQDAWTSARTALPERPRKDKATRSRGVQHSKWQPVALLLLTTLLISIAGVRCWDLVTNRYYLRSTQLSLFGGGISWWFPERALEFVEREKLPANIFNGYILGGFLTWRLFPEYRDYIDSRAIPFGSQLFFRETELSTQPPESDVWRREADALDINTMVVPLGRYQGVTMFPQLRTFCRDHTWRPVYMDEVSAVFVRRTLQTASLVERLQIDCDRNVFTSPAELSAGARQAHWVSRRVAELFNFWANSAEILSALERYPEAFACLDRAQSIFGDSAHLHLLRGQLLQRTGRGTEAEAELRTSLTLESNDQVSLVLGLLYMSQRRYPDALQIFRGLAETSLHPHDMWMLVGQVYLQMRQPHPALEAFDKAVAASPFRDTEASEALGTSFNLMIATGRAKAWYQLGDLSNAVRFQEEAVKLSPNAPRVWLDLAGLYDAQGRSAEAEQARSHALGQ